MNTNYNNLYDYKKKLKMNTNYYNLYDHKKK